MKRSKKFIVSGIWILVCLAMLITISYAWIERDWQPKIQETNIKVQTGSSLMLILDDQETATDTISLNDVLGANSDVVLKQVSNLTGRSEDFFALSYEESITNPKIRKIRKPAADDSWNNTALNEGYFEFRFILYGRSAEDDQSQYIFLSNRSKLDYPAYVREEIAALEAENAASGDAAVIAENNQRINELEDRYDRVLNAIRLSITIERTNVDSAETKCIKYDSQVPHTAITNRMNTSGEYIAEGQYLYEPGGEHVNPSYIDVDMGNFQSLQYYTEAYSSYFDTVDTEKILFVMSSSERRWITVRIWLEGQDEGCIDEISGLEFDLNLVFESKAAI